MLSKNFVILPLTWAAVVLGLSQYQVTVGKEVPGLSIRSEDRNIGQNHEIHVTGDWISLSLGFGLVLIAC